MQGQGWIHLKSWIIDLTKSLTLKKQTEKQQSLLQKSSTQTKSEPEIKYPKQRIKKEKKRSQTTALLCQTK